MIVRIKQEGFSVRKIDSESLQFDRSAADDFKILDLREYANGLKILTSDVF